MNESFPERVKKHHIEKYRISTDAFDDTWKKKPRVKKRTAQRKEREQEAKLGVIYLTSEVRSRPNSAQARRANFPRKIVFPRPWWMDAGDTGNATRRWRSRRQEEDQAAVDTSSSVSSISRGDEEGTWLPVG